VQDTADIDPHDPIEVLGGVVDGEFVYAYRGAVD
jgi:hypothetical protein